MSVERVADNYLRNWMKTRQEAEAKDTELQLVPEQPKVVHMEDTFSQSNVILSRLENPRYYGGLLGRGDRQRVVWVERPEQAKKVSEELVHLYEQKLGAMLFPQHPYVR